MAASESLKMETEKQSPLPEEAMKDKSSQITQEISTSFSEIPSLQTSKTSLPSKNNAPNPNIPQGNPPSDPPFTHESSIADPHKSLENRRPESDIPPEKPLADPNKLPENPPKAKKRRRRKKHFQSPVVANGGLRALRPQVKSGFYSEKLMDEIIQMQINDLPSPSKGKRKKMIDLAKELDIEAMIAASVGFPVDSLTEEEIEAGVVSSIGGIEQTNYTVVRNHILARWRSNVNVWLTKDHAMESIRSEHRSLVNAAYGFLLEHGYINFGLAPAIREAGWNINGTEKANVVIVGAGLAGLAAARQLLSLGFKVLIVEGRNRPGGRVRTKNMCGPGVVAAADLGGSVLTGINGNPLGVLARQLGFPLHKVRDKCPLYRPDGTAVDPELDTKVEDLFNQLLDKVCKLRQAMDDVAVDISLGTALETFRHVYRVAEKSEERMLLNWHLANLEYANASLVSDLSLAFWDQDDPYEMGGDHCFIPGGNIRFVRALAENLPIFYGRTVDTIRYGVDGAQVFAEGQVFRGDMVLCTVPLGVLKRNSIKFVPDLPQSKKDAIQRLGFGLLNKVAMLFPHPFWDGGIDTFGHLTEDTSKRGEFFLFHSYSSVSGGPLLVALVAGESAIEFETMSPVDTVERILEILRGIFGPRGIEVPDPIQTVSTRWGNDRFTYGSYSHVAVGSSGDDYDALAESVGQGRVFFAGEATNKRYPATMHGAFLSGLREAANISRAATNRSLMQCQPERVNAREEIVDETVLSNLFQSPDLTFGSFSVLFEPRSNDLASISLLRASFGGKNCEENTGSGSANRKVMSSPLLLYSMISRQQAVELSEVDGDENRLRVLYQRYGARLVGRKGLGLAGETLIISMRVAKAYPNIEQCIDDAHMENAESQKI